MGGYTMKRFPLITALGALLIVLPACIVTCFASELELIQHGGVIFTDPSGMYTHSGICVKPDWNNAPGSSGDLNFDTALHLDCVDTNIETREDDEPVTFDCTASLAVGGEVMNLCAPNFDHVEWTYIQAVYQCETEFSFYPSYDEYPCSIAAGGEVPCTRVSLSPSWSYVTDTVYLSLNGRCGVPECLGNYEDDNGDLECSIEARIQDRNYINWQTLGSATCRGSDLEGTVSFRGCAGLEKPLVREPEFTLSNPSPAFNIPTGTVKVYLQSSQALALPDDGRTFETATLKLVEQNSGVVRQRLPTETYNEYREYLLSEDRTVVGEFMICEPDSDGTFCYENVPLYELKGVAGEITWVPLLYSVEVSNASTLELVDLDNDSEATTTTYFGNNAKVNVRPDPDNDTETHVIELDPLGDIGKKENLVDALSLLSPHNYVVPENLVQDYLNKLEQGTIEMTGERSEGIDRSFWAEIVVRDAAYYADAYISAMLGGLADGLSNVVEEIRGKKGTGKLLKDKKDQLEKLNNDLLKQRLKEKWKLTLTDNDEVKKMKTRIGEFIGSDGALTTHVLVGKFKQILKFVFVKIKQEVEEDEESGEAKKAFFDILQKVLFATLDLVIDRGLAVFEQGLKSLITSLVNLAHDDLFDSNLVSSYCSITSEYLDESRLEMESWSDDNEEEYRNDRKDVLQTITDLGSDATRVLGYIVPFAKFASEAGDLVETAGDIGKAHPAGRVAQFVGKAVKYIGNGVNFVIPGARLLLLPGTVEEGVDTAFGKKEEEEEAELTRKRVPAGPAARVNRRLFSAAQEEKDALDAVLEELVESLRADDIQDTLSLAGGATGSTLKNDADRLFSSLSVVATQALGADALEDAAGETLRELIENDIDARAAYADLSALLFDLLAKIALGEYAGPDDPYYIADRSRLITAVQSLKAAADSLLGDAAALSDALAGSTVLPAVVIEEVSLVSGATGGNTITSSPETFTLTAHIRNISTASVSDLTAQLTVYSVADSVTVTSSPEVTVAGGTLAPDDAQEGAGDDEADVTWQLQFNGNIETTERIVLSVELLENGETAENFITFSVKTILDYAESVSDKDSDGIYDDYEAQNGLDQTTDDYYEDLDGDGVENGREYGLGTKPNAVDSDGDGLSDGEELTGGEDGFVTDPLDTDTDGDGVKDSDDGQPIDGSTSEKAGLPDEPAVEVDKNEIVLTRDNSIAEVKVTNSGTGTLGWTAAPENGAVVLTSPSASSLRVDEAPLIITVPDGFDFDIACRVTTSVRVSDLYGATKDYRDLTVIVTPSDNATYEDCEDVLDYDFDNETGGDGGDNGTDGDNGAGSDNETACPVESFFAGDRETLTVLRLFRDSVLGRNVTGRAYINLYYTYSSEVAGLLKKDPSLRLQAKKCIESLVPTLRRMVRGERVALSRGEKDSIKNCLEKIAGNAASGLKRKIEQVVHAVETSEMPVRSH